MSRIERMPSAGRLVAGVLLAAAFVVLPGPETPGLIRHSITVDGNVADWGDVLTDPENVVADAGSFSDPPDPDFPGTADRDLRGVAFTWDATNLYVFFRRTLSGNSSFDFLLYIDLGHDRTLQNTDLIWRLSYSGAAYQNGGLNRYQPSDPAGDPITGDGVDEPGSLGVAVPGTPTGANSPDGIEFEASIPWTALGVPAGSCLWLHPSIARGTNLPSQVEDNTDPLDTQDVALRLESDRAGGVASPGTIDYAHRACNDGNCSDTFDLTVRSQRGWRVDLFSDPDGDGDPADGVLLGIDGNGDGDYSDDRDGDRLEPGGDTNGNGLVDTGSVAAGTCFDYVVRIHVPAGVVPGTTDLERVRARSATRPRDLATNSDLTTVGPITIFRDEERSGIAGDDVWVPHRACNNQGFADTLDLASTSSSGWPTETWSDPNGDGDPADGAPVGSVGPLAPGACADLLLRVSIPAGTGSGSVDTAGVTATSQANGSVSDSVADTITVQSAPFTVTPDHARDAGPFNTLFLPHVVTNHQSFPDSFTLDIPTRPAGWILTLLTDPDGDGEPDDSTVIPEGSDVGPVRRNGGRFTFILRVDVPQSAIIGSVNTIVIRARSVDDPALQATATDTITIKRVLTYSDPLFARPSKTFFVSCGRVYVQAHGLQSNRDYRFIWKDPPGGIQRTSPTYRPDARGRVDDSFSIPCGIAPGDWRIDLEIRAGSSWNFLDFSNFTTLDPATDSGEITRLETDQGVYNVDGDLLSVESTLTNETEADYVGTRADYVVFRDLDGDGAPTIGEDYIRPDGTRALWATGDTSHRTVGITVYEGQSYEDYWNIPNAQFEIEGEWCVFERWYTICTSGTCGDVTIDTALRCFLVSCLPAPEVSAGADRQSCAGQGVALADASSDGDTFLWNDGGAGGSFTPSDTVLNPTYTPGGTGTITLTLRATFTSSGCSAEDSLLLTVNPNPVVTAGADKATCAGDGVALSDADGGAADTFSWSDGGGGGTFTPSSTVENPTYANASAGTYTLTLTATISGTGCSASDTVQVVVNANPVVTAGTDKETCAGEGVALADADGGAADTFSWSDGGGGGTFTPSSTVENPTYANAAAGTYTLTFTATIAGSGCDASDTVDVIVDANPVVTAGADKETCAGEGVALSDADGGAADTFSWSDGGGGGTFTPSSTVENPTYANAAAGTYALTFTATISGTGCDASDTVQVVVNANPVVTAGEDKTTCVGVGVALSDADGGAADTFSWSDGGGGGTFTPSSTVENPTYANATAGTYTLALTATISGTGCDASDAVQITVNPGPAVTAGADKATCAGIGASLSDADGGAADTFSWSDGGGGGTFTPSSTVENPTYANATAGTYTLTFTATESGTGCFSTDIVAVVVNPNPVVSAGADKSACPGIAVALSDASGGIADTFSWSDGGGGGTFTPSSTVENPSYSNTTAGTYTLTLTGTVAATGCRSSDAVVVTVGPRPSVDAGAPKDGCAGTSVALSDASSDGVTFSWSASPGGGTFTPSSTVLNPSYRNVTGGTYTLTLTATSGAGCTASDTVTVTLRSLPSASFTVPGGLHCEDTPICFTNTSTQATSYSWQFGDPDGSTSTEFEPCFSYAAPGTYTVTLTATNDCGAATATRQVIVSPVPVADFSFSAQGNRFCRNRNINFTDMSTNSPTSWQWDFGDGATSTVQNPTHAYLTDGVFIIRLVACNACGCSAPVYRAIEIAATCNTNCEANSNQIDCSGGLTIFDGDTCVDHDNFNTTSYPCAPGHVYSGENKTYDLNFLAGSNFVIRIIETVAEPNGYELDLMISDRCNPPRCVAWGDTEVLYDDRTGINDDFFLVVDGRDGSCGPFRLEIDCIDPTEAADCTPPEFDGILDAVDLDPCAITGILVTWNPATNWGTGTDGAPCASGVYEIWRAPSDDLTDERRIGTAPSGETSFVDARAIPGVLYTYRVHAINTCCGEPQLTTATAEARDDFNPQPVVADAGPARTLTCDQPTATLLGSASGGTGTGFDYLWSPATGLSDPTRSNPTVSLPGTYTLTVTDRGNGCQDTDTVVVVANDSPPAVSAGPDKDITCDVPVVVLEGSASGGDDSSGRIYAWTPSGPLDDPSSPTPRTSTPGTYLLRVTDIATGCSATDTVDVRVVVAPPVAGAGPDKVITCVIGEVTLEGSASGGDGRDGYTYSWSPPSGLDDPNAQRPRANVPGSWTVTVTDTYTGCTDTDAVSVTEDRRLPVAGAGSDREITCTEPEVTLDGSASGGNGTQGYTFRWSPPEQVSDPDAEDPTTRIAGTYTLTVTDVANGCTDTDVVEVTRDALVPVADAGPDKEITCTILLVTLEGSASGGDGSGGYSFRWEPAGQVSDPDVAQPTTAIPGTYTLTVTTNINGCTAQDTVVVADNDAPPAVSAGPDKAIDCDSASVVLEGSASGGDGRDGYSYSWSPAGGLSDPSAPQPTCTQPGTFTLTVTDIRTGCVAADSVVVSEDFRAPTVSAGPDKLLDCVATSVVLEGSASGGNGSSGYAYSWSPATGLSDPAIAQPTCTAPGTYTLTVTDRANGCTASDSVLVTRDVRAPVVSAGPDKLLDCVATSVVLEGSASGGNGSSGYAYSWSPATGLSDPAIAQPTCTAPGTYTLTVTDRANGCSASDSVLVTQDAARPVADAGPDRTISCTVPVVTLAGAASGGNGSAGYAFRWAPAGNVSDPNVARPTTGVPGLYTLTVTDRANGCTATDSVFVNDDRIPPTADAGPDPTITCAVPIVTLLGTASGGNGTLGYAFRWEPAANVSDPDVARPATSISGTYTLTVTDRANGCTATDVVVVAQDRRAPAAGAGADKAIDCSAGSVTLDGSASGGNGSLGYAFSWSPAIGLSDPTIARPACTLPGTFTLTVTDLANGCTGMDAVTVTSDLRAPAAGAGPDRVIDCDTPFVVLDGSAAGGNGSGGYAFSWSPTLGLSDPTIARPTCTAPGTYTLLVTDVANGCTGTDLVVVSEDRRAPTADAGPDVVFDCLAPGAMLTGSGTGGNGSSGYAFRWEPAGGVSDPDAAVTQAIAAGTFTLTVTDLANGCTATDQAVVTTTSPSPIADAGPDGIVSCLRPTATLSGSASGGDGSLGYTAQWTPATGVADPNAFVTTTTEPGTYTLLVVDVATGCRAVDGAVVVDDRAPPIAVAGPDLQIDCDTPAVTLQGSASGGNGSAGYAYSWSPSGGLSDPSSATPTTSQAGTWTLVVTDLANGCTALDSVTVAEDRRAPIVAAGADKVIDCDDPSVVLDGLATGGSGAGFGYAWTPVGGLSDPATARPICLAPGRYTLTVTDLGNGCTATDSVDVASDMSSPVADAGTDAALECMIPLVTLAGSGSGGNGSAGYRFRWEPAAGVTDPDAATTQAFAGGTYTLTITDLANGCTATDTVIVTPAVGVPLADAGSDLQQSCGDPVVTLIGRASGGDGSLGYTFRWEPATNVADPDAATTMSSTPGIYTLMVTDVATGCLGVDAVAILRVPDPAFPEPSALDQRPSATPLRVAWLDPIARTTLALAWEDIGAFEYRVYQGTIANFLPPRGTGSYDHGRAACALASPSASLPVMPGAVYFLAVSANCDGTESSYGRDSLGVERPDAMTAGGIPCP